MNDFDQCTGSMNDMHPILVEPGDKDDDGQEHGNGRDAESPVPAFVRLNPHDEHQADRTPDAKTEQQPVKEARHLLLLQRVLLVELVGAMRRQTGLYPACANGDQVQTHEENRGFAARNCVTLGQKHVAKRWLEVGVVSLDSEESKPLNIDVYQP